MKKIGVLALVLLLVASVFVIDTFDLFSGKTSAEVTEISTVTVTGEGTIIINPDIAYINIGVQTQNIEASIAQTENTKIMNQVVEALKEAGISNDDIKTENFSIYRTYDYTKQYQDNPEQIYQVNNNARITIRDIDKVGDIIDVVTTAGANNIYNITFDTTKRAEKYQEALVLAMENAKSKATSIMGTFGEKPEKPYRVSESSYNQGGFQEYSKGIMMDSVSSTPIESGTLSITANVNVEYAY